MKKFKFPHIFCGYGFHVLLVGTILLMIGALAVVVFGVLLDLPFDDRVLKAAFLGYIAIYFPCAYLFLNYRRDDRESMAAASPIEWRPITTAELRRLRSEKFNKPAFLFGFVSSQIFAAGMPLLLIPSTGSDAYVQTVAFIEFIVIVFLGIPYAAKRLDAFRWRNVDETAQVTVRKVSHTYCVGIGGSIFRNHFYFYAVFYTPEGKFVIDLKKVAPDGVTIVKYKNMYTLLT